MWQLMASRWAQAGRHGGFAVLCIALAAGLCWWQATVFLQATQPASRVVPVPFSSAQAAAEVAAQAWFGMAPVAADGGHPAVEVLGILAGQQGSDKDFVLLRENGQSFMLKTGQQAPSGWVLQQLLSHSIKIEKAGMVYELPLSRTPGAQPLAVPVAVPGEVSQLPLTPPQAAVKEPVAMPPATLLQQD